jgi:hypothetical protein
VCTIVVKFIGPFFITMKENDKKRYFSAMVIKRGVVVRLALIAIALYGNVTMFYGGRSLTAKDDDVSLHQSTELAVVPLQQNMATKKREIAKPNKKKKKGMKTQQDEGAQSALEPAVKAQIVDTSKWAKPLSKNYRGDKNDIWESDLTIPVWMTNYFRFHKERVRRWNDNTYTLDPNTKYLYVTCLKDYHKCGGTADRLLSLPFLVKVAAQTKRVLLIQWAKPAALEEFLLPPVNGLDWRVPATKEAALRNVGEKAGTQDTILEMAQDQSIQVVQVKFQSHDHGSLYYDSIRESNEERDFKHIFHSLWRVLFTPSSALAQKIQETMDQIGLIPDQYSSAHLRALYGVETRDNVLVAKWAQNAVQCSLRLQKETTLQPVYFASDSDVAIQQAGNHASIYGYTVLTRTTQVMGRHPLHLDKTKDWNERPASDFYDAFVDLYIMSLGKCVAYGMGGYGKFASYMSDHVSCSMVHMTATAVERCPLPTNAGVKRRRKGISPPPKSVETTATAKVAPEHNGLLFLPPVTHIESETKITQTSSNKKVIFLRNTNKRMNE